MTGNKKIPLCVTDRAKLEALRPLRKIGSFKDHKLDRVIFENGAISKELLLRCGEYLHESGESFISSSSISSFSVSTGLYTYDFHPLGYLEAAVGEKSKYENGVMYQVFDERRNDYCVCAGIICHLVNDAGCHVETSIIYIDDFYSTILDEDDLDVFTRQAGTLFFITQYAMRTRPLEFRERMERSQYRIHAPGTKEHRRRVVQMVRTVYIDTSGFSALENGSLLERKIECPCWGVMGHWRYYKSGKKVWIKPYRKGRERNNPGSYCSKDYKNKEVSL